MEQQNEMKVMTHTPAILGEAEDSDLTSQEGNSLPPTPTQALASVCLHFVITSQSVLFPNWTALTKLQLNLWL